MDCLVSLSASLLFCPPNLFEIRIRPRPWDFWMTRPFCPLGLDRQQAPRGDRSKRKHTWQWFQTASGLSCTVQHSATRNYSTLHCTARCTNPGFAIVAFVPIDPERGFILVFRICRLQSMLHTTSLWSRSEPQQCQPTFCLSLSLGMYKV